MKSVEKILVIKLRAIGDVVLSTIVLENLREAFPVARIDFLTEKASKEVVFGNPVLNNVLIYDKRAISKMSFFRRIVENIRFIKTIRNLNYDLVFDFFGNPRSAFFTYASGARVRIGYDYNIRKWCYTNIVKSRANEIHEADWHLDALDAFDIPILTRRLNFEVGIGSQNFADNFWTQSGLDDKRVIAIHFAGSWPAKRWELDRFSHLIDLLGARYKAKILISWGPGEFDDAKRIQENAVYPSTLLPQTGLKQLAAILKKVDLFITSDSGPMHIAAAMETPCVALFGPTNPKLQGPYGEIHQVVTKPGLNCLGCNKLECDHLSCMKLLTVKDVISGVERCVRKNHLFEDPV